MFAVWKHCRGADLRRASVGWVVRVFVQRSRREGEEAEQSRAEQKQSISRNEKVRWLVMGADRVPESEIQHRSITI